MQVQRHLQLRIEAHGKYMQTILEKACQTVLAGENIGSYKAAAEMKEVGPNMNNFPSLQDLNIYGSSDHLDLHHHHQNNSMQDQSFITDNLLAKKRYTNSGKSPLLWADELGTTATAAALDDIHHIHIDRGSTDIDSSVYETKPMLSDGGDKKLSPPRRTPTISAGGMQQQGRSSPAFG